jgi:transcriptional regulator with XRE-family HTH domain
MLNGDRLRTLRESKGYTHQELAYLLEISIGQIWRYEAGKTDPSGDVLARMSRVLGTTTDYLLGLTDDSIPSNLNESDLTHKERTIIAALREGRNYEAIKMIVQDA